eukprot:11776009-Ditylum_brightwellii.AAC.1
MKKSAKPAPATTAMVIYDDAFDDISDTNLLFYEPEMDKKKNTGNHANLNCDVEYDTPPTAQHSVK